MGKKTNEKKPADKKGQGSKDAGAKEEKKVKAAQQINVRHILVCTYLGLIQSSYESLRTLVGGIAIDKSFIP